ARKNGGILRSYKLRIKLRLGKGGDCSNQRFLLFPSEKFLLALASQMARGKSKSSSSNNSAANIGFESKLWLAANKRRALIQMATGSGKTYTAVNFVYRLI